MLKLFGGRAPLSRRIDVASGRCEIPAGLLSMITGHECQALAAFAEHLWAQGARRDGLIVDGGAFVGASTLALAQGLARGALSEDERLERIWSYDLFLTTGGMAAKYFGPGGPREGESFRPVFEANIAPFRRYVRVCEGDIRQGPFPDRAVALLFLDILWNWDATVAVSRAFYPRLEPGRSILIHQDFVYPFYPWVILGMGMLEQHLSFARVVPYSSVVFDVVKPLRASQIDDPRNLAPARALAIYDSFIARVEGWERGALGLGKALFLASNNRTAEARALIQAVAAAHADEPLVQQYVDPISFYCDQTELRGTAKPLEDLAGRPMRESFAESAA